MYYRVVPCIVFVDKMDAVRPCPCRERTRRIQARVRQQARQHNTVRARPHARPRAPTSTRTLRCPARLEVKEREVGKREEEARERGEREGWG